MIQKIKNNAFARNSIVLFAGTMAANILNYVFHLMVGRIVSVEVYGEIQSVASLISIISVPAMTLTMIAAKYSASSKAENDRKGSYEIIKYLSQKVVKFGLPVFVLALLITPYVADFLNIKSNFPVVLIWLLMLLSFFGSINQGVLQGWQKFRGVSWVGIWGSVVKLIIGLILVGIGFGLNGAIGGFVLGAVASYISSIITLRFILKEKNGGKGKVDGITFRSIKNYVMPVFVGNLAINILGNADMVIAKHNLDSVVAGQYGALTIVSKIIFFATGVIASVLFAMSAEDSHKKNNPIAILKNASYLMLFVSLCATAVYFFMPDFVFGLLFGSRYFVVSHYLGWFAVAVTLFSFVNLLFQYLLSIHKTEVVYSFLTLSIIMALVVLFLGKSISAILIILIIFQLSAIGVGLIFLLSDKKEIKKI